MEKTKTIAILKELGIWESSIAYLSMGGEVDYIKVSELVTFLHASVPKKVTKQIYRTALESRHQGDVEKIRRFLSACASSVEGLNIT